MKLVFISVGNRTEIGNAGHTNTHMPSPPASHMMEEPV